MPKQPATKFLGFHSPTTTPVPDELFDQLLHTLSGAELKVTLYIIRRTFGFKKDKDDISLSQMVNGIVTRDGAVLDHGTGLTKETVTKAIKSLEERGVIIRNKRQSAEKGYEATTYYLHLAPLSENLTSHVRKIEQGLSENPTKPLVEKSDIQQTVLQQTDRQDVVVVNELQKFGVTEKSASQLANQ